VKRIILIILAIVVIGLVAILAMAHFGLGPALKAGAENFGPMLTGTAIEVQSASISLFTGKGELTGVIVGNPENFHTDNAFQVERIAISIAPMSLLRNEIHVREIRIISPRITYERSLKTSNLRTILDNIDEFTGPPKAPTTDQSPPPPSQRQRSVRIDELEVSGATVRSAVTGLPNQTLSLTLPRLQMNDLGGDGQSVAETVREVVRALFDAVTQVIQGSQRLLQRTGSELKDAGEAVRDTMQDTLRNTRNLFREK